MATALAAAVPAFLTAGEAGANTQYNVPDGTVDLATLVPTPAATDDLTFTNIAYTNTAFTLSTSLSIGTLDNLNTTQALTIGPGAPGVASVLTLNGGANSVAPSAADLLYVASGGSLTINTGVLATAGTLTVTLGASGNLHVAGTGVAAINTAINAGAIALVKTGTGTLTLNANNIASTGTLTIANGTVSTNNTNGLGASANPVSIGSSDPAASSNNATLQLTGTPSLKGIFTIASGAGTRTITSNNATAFPATGAVLDAASSILLNNNLILSETSTGSMQVRGTITESATFGLIIDAATTGVVQLSNTASTFTGGVAINGGTLSIAGNTSAPGGFLQGPTGRGTVTLGGAASATAATLGTNGNFTLANAITVNAGGTRTLGALNGASTAAGVFTGAITLNTDLILAAPLTTAAMGVTRLRMDGAITGSNNLIVQNGNSSIGAVAGSGSVRFGGNNAAFTGSLIVATGRAGLQSVASVNAANTVGVASLATFDFAEGAISPTIAGLRNATSSGALSGSTGGTVLITNGTNRTLTLAGGGNYSFNGTITDNPTLGAGLGVVNLTVGLATAGASQTLASASPYTGTTGVNRGKLILTNGSGSGTGTGAVNLGSATLGTPTNATLSGTGSSSGLLTTILGARLAPGVNTVDADASTRTNFGVAGTLTAGSIGGATFTSGSFDFDLATTAAGANDLLAVGGTASFGTMAFTFYELGGALQTGTPYTLINGATATSGFETAAFTTSFLNGDAYTPTYSLSGNNLQVSFEAIPEPTSVGILGLVAIGLAGRRSRRR